MFGLLLIVTKKALLLTKVALFLSGLLGWNSIFSGAAAPYVPNRFNDFPAYGQEMPPVFHSHYDHHFPQRPYRTLQDFVPYDQHVVREVVNVYERDSSGSGQNAKNFVWTKE